MPKYIRKQMLKCSVTLTPKQAIAFRELGLELTYHCPNPECNQEVIAVSKGKDKGAGVTFKAHFEHRKRNPECPYGKGIKNVSSNVEIVPQIE